MDTVGSILVRHLSGAISEVTIVAPFIKANVLQDLLFGVPHDVRLCCITRWHPHEIKAGISDLQVWDLIKSWGSGRLLLIPTLHAKYYRADGKYVVGSANLTKAALGWSSRPNVELALLGKVDSSLSVWEQELVSQATQVDDSLFRHFERLVSELPEMDAVLPEVDNSPETWLEDFLGLPEFESGSWLPATRFPEQLYDAYQGDIEAMSSGLRETCFHDLWALGVPKGLTRSAFQAYIAATVLQMPLVRELDAFLIEPKRFGAVRDFLASRVNYPRGQDASSHWQTIMRWFLHFLPHRYSIAVPNYSEITFRIE